MEIEYIALEKDNNKKLKDILKKRLYAFFRTFQ